MSFCFATVTSKGYTDQTAGLWLNLQSVHPGTELVICCVDEHAWHVFSTQQKSSLRAVSAEQVWGAEAWRNMRARMTLPELAYATKAALAAHLLEQGQAAVMVLDSDLLFMEPVADLLEKCVAHDALLVAARHDLTNWRKSNTFGLFSAGIVGFSSRGLKAAQIWRAQVFEDCRAIPLAGLFNEQKYLDYMVGFFDVHIVRDAGINVSPTMLKLVKPREVTPGKWQAEDGTAVRIFHYSRSASSDLPFAVMKRDLNQVACAQMGKLLQAEVASPVSTETRLVGGGHRRLRLTVLPGAILDRLVPMLGRLLRWIFDMQRVFSLTDMSLKERWTETFGIKKTIKKQLDDMAFRLVAEGDRRD